MKDVMIDLETLGTGARAVIVSCGATFFDEELLGDAFYVCPSRDEQTSLGREISPDTIKWWGEQSKAAQNVFNEPQTSLEIFTDAFAAWLHEHCPRDEVRIWGNGATFDNVILASLWADVGKELPWRFFNDRCYRTLKNLGIAPFDSHDMPERGGTHHHGLDDARYQAAVAGRYLKALKLKGWSWK